MAIGLHEYDAAFIEPYKAFHRGEISAEERDRRIYAAWSALEARDNRNVLFFFLLPWLAIVVVVLVMAVLEG